MSNLRRDERTGRWWFQYYGADGRRRTVRTGTTDQRVAKSIRDKVLGDTAQRKVGLRTAETDAAERAAKTGLAEHVDAYLAWCRGRSMAPRHIQQKSKHLADAIRFLRAARLADLTVDGVERFLASLRHKDRSARTRNTYRADVLAFAAWAVQTGRLPGPNPLARVTKAREETDRRRTYRPFTDAELERLLAHVRQVDAQNRDARRGPRAPVYLVAVLTGLRHGELRGLEWRDVDLVERTLTVRAVLSKGRRDDVIPLHEQAAAELARLRPPDAVPTDRVFPRMVTYRTTLQDIAGAGLDRDDGAGGTLCFHSFRVTTATKLARLGVAPQTAQRILRHRDVQTTMRHYTRLRLEDTAAGIARMPAVGGMAASEVAAVG